MDECSIIRLNNLISYISPTENPLSANVVMIQGKDALWLYDVGNHPDIPQVIEQFRDGRNVNVILSHFHEDHIGNLPGMGVDEVYQGKYTHRHTGMGTDALYSMQKCGHNLYNAGILKDEINVLQNIKAEKFMLSHRTPFEKPKGIIMRWLGEIYDRRVKGEVYIEI